MKVTIKEFAVIMELKNNGVEFEIKDNDDTHRGDLRIGKATIEWCRGRTHTGRGVRKTWDEPIAWFEN